MSLVALRTLRRKALARWERADHCDGWGGCHHHRDYPRLHVFAWIDRTYSYSLLAWRGSDEHAGDIDRRAQPSFHAAAQCGMQLWSKKYLSRKP